MTIGEALAYLDGLKDRWLLIRERSASATEWERKPTARASVRRLKGESLEGVLIRLAVALRDCDAMAKRAASRRGDAAPALRRRLRAAQVVAGIVEEIGAR